jgi:acyl carrier protein
MKAASDRVANTERVIMTVRPTILTLFTQVAREQDKELRPLSDDLELLETGLDSLCFAIIVARLEDTLGIDPFSTADEEAYPVTVGDFIRLYENAAA